jgi:hypothetical protein
VLLEEGIESAGDFAGFGNIGQSDEEIVAITGPDFFADLNSVALEPFSGVSELLEIARSHGRGSSLIGGCVWVVNRDCRSR